MTTAMTMNAAKKLLECPISYELMRQPVYLDPCHHTFEKTNIRTWIIRAPISACPLCKRSVTAADVKDSRLVKIALEILKMPKNIDLENMADITDTSQRQTVERALTAIENRRREDALAQIPYRLTLEERAAVFIKDVPEDCREASDESLAYVGSAFSSSTPGAVAAERPAGVFVAPLLAVRPQANTPEDTTRTRNFLRRRSF